MQNLEIYFGDLVGVYGDLPRDDAHLMGGLFLEESAPRSFVSFVSTRHSPMLSSIVKTRKGKLVGRRQGFLCVTLTSVNDRGDWTESSILGDLKEKNGDRETEPENGTVTLNDIATANTYQDGFDTYFLKIVQEGRIPALYAGVIPSLLQIHCFSYIPPA